MPELTPKQRARRRLDAQLTSSIRLSLIYKAHQFFSEQLPGLLDEFNEVLAA